MHRSKRDLWTRFQQFYTEFPSLGLAVDLSRMNFTEEFLTTMAPKMDRAFSEMAALEKGSMANPDENRMVGHYWLRDPELAPALEIRAEIERTQEAIQQFARKVHDGSIRYGSEKYTELLVIGIGGSALGPQFVAAALGRSDRDAMRVHFLDNTDPDGMDEVLTGIGDRLASTLCIVISKSGGTKETRNGMLETKAAFDRRSLDFAKHAVAVTGSGSELDQIAVRDGWIQRFPMWDWVGGRTSETSAVGLLPAALQGLDVQRFLEGAKACDEVTRLPQVKGNPAAQLALMWYWAGNGAGQKDMVILPYKDRLALFSRYLQQLIMESLGKEHDRDGKVVHQGIAVYGNKGSTDQHAYIQQLRDGVNNLFVTFIRVLKERDGMLLEVEPDVTSGDYLQGFLLGTREALFENGRESITLTIRDVSAFSVGVLIALYERAVGLYASLINVNAYHQPGVEAGKKAAGSVLRVQNRVMDWFKKHPGRRVTVDTLSAQIGMEASVEVVFHVCEQLVANVDRRVRKGPGLVATEASYWWE